VGNEDALLDFLHGFLILKDKCILRIEQIAKDFSARYDDFGQHPYMRETIFYYMISKDFFPILLNAVKEAAPNQIDIEELEYLFSEFRNKDIRKDDFVEGVRGHRREAGGGSFLPSILISKMDLLKSKIQVIIDDPSTKTLLMEWLQDRNLQNITIYELRQIKKKWIEISEAIEGLEYGIEIKHYLIKQLFAELCECTLLRQAIKDTNVQDFVRERLEKDVHFNIELLCAELKIEAESEFLRYILRSQKGSYHEILGGVRDISKLKGYFTKIEKIRRRCINRISIECSEIAKKAVPNMQDAGVYIKYILRKFYPQFIKILQEAIKGDAELAQEKIENDLSKLISELIQGAQKLELAGYNRVPVLRYQGLRLISPTDDIEVLMSQEEKTEFANKLHEVCQATAGEIILTGKYKDHFEQRFKAIEAEYLQTGDMVKFIFESYKITREILKKVIGPQPSMLPVIKDQFIAGLREKIQKNLDLDKVIARMEKLGHKLDEQQPVPSHSGSWQPVPSTSSIFRFISVITLGTAAIGGFVGAGVLIAATGGIAAAPLIPLVGLAALGCFASVACCIGAASMVRLSHQNSSPVQQAPNGLVDTTTPAQTNPQIIQPNQSAPARSPQRGVPVKPLTETTHQPSSSDRDITGNIYN